MTQRITNIAGQRLSADDASGALLVQDSSVSGFAGGQKTLAAATRAEPLVAISTPCRNVWIGPITNADGVVTNTKAVFIGDAGSQNIPVLVSNVQGVNIPIDDAAKIYVKAGVNGEGVNYRILA